MNKVNKKRVGSKTATTQTKSKKTTSNVTKVVDTAGKIAGAVTSVINLATTVASLNSESWYSKFGKVTPAKNLLRPMEPLFNTSITTDPTLGGVARFIDVQVTWTGFSTTYAFEQVVEKLFQALREDLRSNLPYTQDEVKACLVQSIALTAAMVQLERNIQWDNYAHPSIRNFSKMWKLFSHGTGYGIVSLAEDEQLSSDNISTTISNYDLAVEDVNGSLYVPPALWAFLSHYFGKVFVDSSDHHNDQYIRLILDSIEWGTYSDSTYTSSVLSLMELTPSDVIAYMRDYNKQFGVILADLSKKGIYKTPKFHKYGDWEFVAYFDPSLNQALVNGYTDDSAVGTNGYVRMDEMEGADPLTQYLFLGAFTNSSLVSVNSLSQIPALTIESMVYKFDSDSTLTWPASLSQVGGTDDTTMTFSEPIGVKICTDMSADTYVTAAIASTSKVVACSAVSTSNSLAFSDYSSMVISAATTTLTQYQMATSGEHYIAVSYATAQTYGVGYGHFFPLFYATISDGSYFYFGVIAQRVTTSTWYVRIAHARSDYGPSTLFTTSSASYQGGYDYYSETLVNSNDTGAIIGTINGCSVGIYTSSSTDAGFYPTGCSGISLYWATTVSNFVSSPTVVASSYLVDGVVVQYSASSTSYTLYLGIGFPDSSGYTYTNTVNGSTSTRSITGFENLLSGYSDLGSVACTSETTGTSASTVSGYTGLAAWLADQYDYHLPIYLTYKAHINITEGDDTVVSNTFNYGDVLVKEAYKPYFYNIVDLVPVIYQMMTSLFSF